MRPDDREFWNEFYRRSFIANPSPFAEFCQEHYLSQPRRIVEFGSGSGRDLHFFYENGHDITGFDTCAEAVAHVGCEWPDIDYRVGDFSQLGPLTGIEAVYSRWTMHAVDETSEQRAMSWASRTLADGGLMMIEARTINDHLYGVGKKVGKNAFYTDHYRRFIDPDGMAHSLRKLGFRALYQVESDGFSVYNGDNPVLLRIVAEKSHAVW
ncbi:MAG: class I SAM-dependent methyltransferase [Lentisphaerae bacterium]|jgi:tellurite methyltransferase|nr:class I SAM-dependent methyltransferase [Lentisphaerota bacterium]MBT5607052.1 class I SAM-dependent methyltransferase [Lentisphaerota bacterium]MBT7055806.1 class I SAM-dependent methyltransferase [Lentisphaerota bacterium]